MIAAPPLPDTIDNGTVDNGAISIHRYLVTYGEAVGRGIEHLCRGLLRYTQEKKDDQPDLWSNPGHLLIIKRLSLTEISVGVSVSE